MYLVRDDNEVDDNASNHSNSESSPVKSGIVEKDQGKDDSGTESEVEALIIIFFYPSLYSVPGVNFLNRKID